MLKILGFAKDEQSCFECQKRADCVVVKFNDGTFHGVLCWECLLSIFKRKVKIAEQEKAKREAEQASPASIVKPKD